MKVYQIFILLSVIFIVQGLNKSLLSLNSQVESKANTVQIDNFYDNWQIYHGFNNVFELAKFDKKVQEPLKNSEIILDQQLFSINGNNYGYSQLIFKNGKVCQTENDFQSNFQSDRINAGDYLEYEDSFNGVRNANKGSNCQVVPINLSIENDQHSDDIEENYNFEMPQAKNAPNEQCCMSIQTGGETRQIICSVQKDLTSCIADIRILRKRIHEGMKMQKIIEKDIQMRVYVICQKDQIEEIQTKLNQNYFNYLNTQADSKLPQVENNKKIQVMVYRSSTQSFEDQHIYFTDHQFFIFASLNPPKSGYLYAMCEFEDNPKKLHIQNLMRQMQIRHKNKEQEQMQMLKAQLKEQAKVKENELNEIKNQQNKQIVNEQKLIIKEQTKLIDQHKEEVKKTKEQDTQAIIQQQAIQNKVSISSKVKYI